MYGRPPLSAGKMNLMREEEMEKLQDELLGIREPRLPGRRVDNAFYPDFAQTYFIAPVVFSNSEQLQFRSAEIAAGHGGMVQAERTLMKPFNLRCLRHRREHLFYQLAAFFQRSDRDDLVWSDFPLLVHPDKTYCECKIDPETFKCIYQHIPRFKFCMHILKENEIWTSDKRFVFFDHCYSWNTWCPCYGDDRKAKDRCCREFYCLNYICMEDLTAHCKVSNIMDLKIGNVTYDIMAHKDKITEQKEKYPRLGSFGFRILGIRGPYVCKDKDWGRTLVNQDAIFDTMEAFFHPLKTPDKKCAVMTRVLDRLNSILLWFETQNSNQARFYSSSILIVFDSKLHNPKGSSLEICAQFAESVRVKMIDFAHVFHTHEPAGGPSRSGSISSVRCSEGLNKDDGYLYGLRRLIKFFIIMVRTQRAEAAKLEAMNELKVILALHKAKPKYPGDVYSEPLDLSQPSCSRQ